MVIFGIGVFKLNVDGGVGFFMILIGVLACMNLVFMSIIVWFFILILMAWLGLICFGVFFFCVNCWRMRIVVIVLLIVLLIV